jgi:hypothetical protein
MSTNNHDYILVNKNAEDEANKNFIMFIEWNGKQKIPQFQNSIEHCRKR